MCGEFDAFPSNETATSVGEAKLRSSTNHMLSACKRLKSGLRSRIGRRVRIGTLSQLGMAIDFGDVSRFVAWLSASGCRIVAQDGDHHRWASDELRY